MMVAIGSVQLIQFTLEAIFNKNIIQNNSSSVPLGISLLIVGVPIWIIHWRIIKNRININSYEELSIIRTVFIYTVLAISIAVLTSSTIGIFQVILGIKDSAWLQTSTIIPYSVIWTYHWILSNPKELSSPSKNLVQRIYIYSSCIFGLIILSTGIGTLLYSILKSGYDVILNSPMLFENEETLWESTKEPIISLASGLLLWGSHWLLFGLKDRENRVKSLYLYLITIGGGIIPITIASISLLYGIFQFILQINLDNDVIPQLPGSISSITVGLILFTYHYYVIKHIKINKLPEVNSQNLLFVYVFSFIGVISSSVGISVLIQSILASIANSLGNTVFSDSETSLEIISLALSTIIVGGSIWGYCYKKIAHFTNLKSSEYSSIRRIYLISILGIFTIVAVILGTSGLFLMLRDIISNNVGINTLKSISIPISVLISYLIITPYHWLLYKKEPSYNKKSEHTKIASKKRKNVTILLPDNNQFFLGQLEEDLGYSIKSLRWKDVNSENIQLDLDSTINIVESVNNMIGNEVLIIPENGGVRIYSYEN